MSKVTISFEGSVKALAEVIPAMTRLLAPAPLNFCIEETADQPAVKRPTRPAVKPIPTANETDNDAEKKAQAKREAAKRHAEKKKAEKAATVTEPDESEKPTPSAKPAKPAKASESGTEITMTTLRAAAAKLPKAKLVPILEELGVAKLTELTEDDFEKALAAFESANE